MPWADPFVWQAIAFSLTAVFLVTGLTWWLYGSPLPPPVPVRHPPSSRLAGCFTLVLALSGGLWVIGGLWDGSMHIKTGKIPAGADFLWPPHLVTYAGFLVAFLVAATAIALIAVPQWRTGVRDPRRWVRRHPALGVVALAALYMLMANSGGCPLARADRAGLDRVEPSACAAGADERHRAGERRRHARPGPADHAAGALGQYGHPRLASPDAKAAAVTRCVGMGMAAGDCRAAPAAVGIPGGRWGANIFSA